ncbi:MAG: hypothetical protein OXP66_00235 [Candidatus Tectomicrobia bacterium]|nr:hypothetical protein [Candidatus Tectomicrobia bacterium]
MHAFRAFRPAGLAAAVLLLAAFSWLPAPSTAVTQVPVLSDDSVPVLEGGGTSTVSVMLNSNPGRTVTVSITRIRAGTDVRLSTTSLTFKSGNWNTPKAVTLIGPASRSGFQYRPNNYFEFTVAGTTNTALLEVDVVDIHWRTRRPGVRVEGTTPAGWVFVPDYAYGTYRIRPAAQPFAEVFVHVFAKPNVLGTITFNTAHDADGNLRNRDFTLTVQNWDE